MNRRYLIKGLFHKWRYSLLQEYLGNVLPRDEALHLADAS